MNKNKKMKGFTLIELIVVIAILGIMAAIAVPNVKQYIAKAKISKAKNDAKIIMDAFEAYNADAALPLSDETTNLTTIKGNAYIVNDTSGLIKAWPIEFNTENALKITVGQLKNVVAGQQNLNVDTETGNVDGVDEVPAT